MLRLVGPEQSPPAYRVPWRVDRVYDAHPLVTNASDNAVDFVRVFVDGDHDGPEMEFWGQMLPGETAELCLCDHDPEDVVVTLSWFRPETGAEYVWRFVVDADCERTMDTMGQFNTSPEEPSDWAGLPSEPLAPRPAAESLDAPIESADSLAFWGTTIESVVIPVVPVVEIAQTAADTAEGDPPG